MNFFFDYPESRQFFFQDPASPVMEGIIDFHHDLTGILIWIGLFVLWMTYAAVRRYHYSPEITWEEYKNQRMWDQITLPSLRNHGPVIAAICVVYQRVSASVVKFYDVAANSLIEMHEKNQSANAKNVNFGDVNLEEISLWLKSPKFRGRASRLGLPIVHHTNLEIVWTIVPAFILMGIAIPSFALLYAMDELVAPLITVKIVGRQWYWQYEYSDHSCDYIYDSRIKGDAANDWYVDPQFIRMLDVDKPIVLPQRVHVRLLITAGDVLHSFAVPSLGIKLDACPGRLNQTALYAKRVGVFYGQCSEICGINHAFMPIAVNVVPFEDYVQWYLKHKPTLV